MMPKINVYLPDDLADAVRTAGVPVSAICQRALETAVKRITAIRGAVLGDATDADDRMPNVAPRAKQVIAAATRAARDTGAPAVDTGHLLAAILDQRENLAVAALTAMDIDPAGVTAALPAHRTPPAGEPPAELHFAADTAAVFELALHEAFALGHNYIGTEHLLLGLITEADGPGGDALRAAGADARQTRRTVTAALAGFVHQRNTTPTATTTAAGNPAADPAAMRAALTAAIQQALAPITARLDRLEARFGDTEG
jgi:ATP-dependent Clp protease ATP-binding subunit ClpA